MSAYSELEKRFRRMGALGQAAAVLHWDRSVLMPPGGGQARTEQLSALRLVVHEMKTDPRLAELLDDAERAEIDDPWRKANLREMRRSWIHANAVDARLVEMTTRACASCELAWRDARPAGDFANVAPLLDEVLKLARETAAAKAAPLGCSPYDALLDQYEPGGRADCIEALFSDLEAFLPDVLDRALSVQAENGRGKLPEGPFPIDRQRALAERLMRAFGFDFDRGRLDVSLHPFCGGVPGDVRVTTRYSEEDFTESLMGVLHETGHALYETNLPEDWRYQPVGGARGMVLHESQSLLVEMQVCRGREFLEYAVPAMREAFDGAGEGWDVDNFHRLYTRVEPGFIRVDADEITYPAHVVLRYRLERAMIEGDLAVSDLPGAWNDASERLLGIRPPNDRLGCLQDIHWYDGAWGYFPTYTLGALAAAQFYAAAKAANPGLPQALAKGEFAPLLEWMRVHLHAKASSRSTGELLEETTGARLGTAAFKAHLEARYL